MAQCLTIVAKIEVIADKVDIVKPELIKLIAPTLKEEGCLQYDLHQDNSNPAIFLFFERWETREMWQSHMQSQHSAEFAQATDGLIKSVVLNEMTKTE